MEVHVHRHRQAGDTAIGMPPQACVRVLAIPPGASVRRARLSELQGAVPTSTGCRVQNRTLASALPEPRTLQTGRIFAGAVGVIAWWIAQGLSPGSERRSEC